MRAANIKDLKRIVKEFKEKINYNFNLNDSRKIIIEKNHIRYV